MRGFDRLRVTLKASEARTSEHTEREYVALAWSIVGQPELPPIFDLLPMSDNGFMRERIERTLQQLGRTDEPVKLDCHALADLFWDLARSRTYLATLREREFMGDVRLEIRGYEMVEP